MGRQTRALLKLVRRDAWERRVRGVAVTQAIRVILRGIHNRKKKSQRSRLRVGYKSFVPVVASGRNVLRQIRTKSIAGNPTGVEKLLSHG